MKLLQERPLPDHEGAEDKEGRGRVLVVGGSREIPGAALLAGVAALRAGAGKVQIATVRSVAPQLALAFPESRVFWLPETSRGGIDAAAAEDVLSRMGEAKAVLVGPGMIDREATTALTARIMAEPGPRLVVDAGCLAELSGCRAAARSRDGRLVLTPHAGEMASLMGVAVEEVEADPVGWARRASDSFQAVVALKGRRTHIAAPDGQMFAYDGCVALAVSGSGDVLAGLIVGLLARGASALDAALWGVYIHAEAGKRLALPGAVVGVLPRELPAEARRVMSKINAAAASAAPRRWPGG